MNMKLLIDTSDYDKIVIALDGEGSKHQFESRNLSETLVPEIKKFLKKNKIQFSNIKKVEIKTGEHFSRTRTTIAVANALIFALKLPQKMFKPIYVREPNITLPRRTQK